MDWRMWLKADPPIQALRLEHLHLWKRSAVHLLQAAAVESTKYNQ